MTNNIDSRHYFTCENFKKDSEGNIEKYILEVKNKKNEAIDKIFVSPKNLLSSKSMKIIFLKKNIFYSKSQKEHEKSIKKIFEDPLKSSESIN